MFECTYVRMYVRVCVCSSLGLPVDHILVVGVPPVVVAGQILGLVLDSLRQDGGHVGQLTARGRGAVAGVDHVVGGGVVLNRVSGHASIGGESHA